ncbi:transcription factor IIA, alpha/beta subunit [Xylariales sp. PMI_506]|nr:transcription factor IIA, alpha/beta subunit [Xylariales sp. PMI_506]
MAAQRVTQPGAPAFSPTQPQPMVKTEPGVKIEPGLDPNTQMPHISNPNVQARVINNLQHTYGARADATISKLQESMGPGANGAQYSAPQRPGQPGPQQAHPQYQANTLQQQQYRQQLAAGQGQPRVPPQPQAGQNGQKPGPSQFDGAEDGFSGVLMHQNSAGETTELGRVEIDRMLHEQILARAKSMEGGGLMLPLKRTANKPSAISYHRGQPNSGPGRFDGGDDDLKSDDDDEAINSELDDSDDNLDEDDEDEDGGQIMLCMYDKVQRVKNKWKCVLKDGVLSVNGKDYVFHKASGEYEW